MPGPIFRIALTAAILGLSAPCQSQQRDEPATSQALAQPRSPSSPAPSAAATAPDDRGRPVAPDAGNPAPTAFRYGAGFEARRGAGWGRGCAGLQGGRGPGRRR